MSIWGDWSTCSRSCGGGEMVRSRLCLTGCESSTADLTQTQECNDQQCPFCIRATSSQSTVLCKRFSCTNCHTGWNGNAIRLKHNGNTIATIPAGFTVFEHCLNMDDVDVTNDKFQLQSTGNNEVCITSLRINQNLIYAGENNHLRNFWIGGDDPYCFGNFMTSSQITIRNGRVISSACTGTTEFQSFVCNV